MAKSTAKRQMKTMDTRLFINSIWLALLTIAVVTYHMFYVSGLDDDIHGTREKVIYHQDGAKLTKEYRDGGIDQSIEKLKQQIASLSFWGRDINDELKQIKKNLNPNQRNINVRLKPGHSAKIDIKRDKDGTFHHTITIDPK